MEAALLILDVLKFAIAGFLALLVALFVLAFVFGKRVHTRWDFEADFLDARGRRVCEFEIELSRIEGTDEEDRLRASFHLRHPELRVGRAVQVVLDEEVVMQGTVGKARTIRLDRTHLTSELKSPAVGQTCVVRVAEVELFAEPLRKD